MIIDLSENRGVVELSLDDGARLRVRKKDVAALSLRKDGEVDAETLENRLCAAQSADAYEAALTLLDFSARTEREMERKLRFKGFLPRVCEATVERLREARLLNDAELAGRMVSSASAGRMGEYALKRKLRAKGVSEADADAALSEIDPERQVEAAKNAASKLARKYENLPAREMRAKLSQALARRGFPWDVIPAAIEALSGEQGDEFDE